jgi:hypothetical protein
VRLEPRQVWMMTIRHFDNLGAGFVNPLAIKILKACDRLETAARLIEHKTDAPSTLYFCISQAFKDLNSVVNKYYTDFPSRGVWL